MFFYIVRLQYSGPEITGALVDVLEVWDTWCDKYKNVSDGESFSHVLLYPHYDQYRPMPMRK